MEDCKHCPDHHDQEICLVKLKGQLDSIKKDGHSKLEGLMIESEKLWKAMDTKLSAKAFAWIIGILVGIMMTVMSSQAIMLWSINNKVNSIAVTQGVLLGTLGVDTDHLKGKK